MSHPVTRTAAFVEVLALLFIFVAAVFERGVVGLALGLILTLVIGLNLSNSVSYWRNHKRAYELRSEVLWEVIRRKDTKWQLEHRNLRKAVEIKKRFPIYKVSVYNRYRRGEDIEQDLPPEQYNMTHQRRQTYVLCVGFAYVETATNLWRAGRPTMPWLRAIKTTWLRHRHGAFMANEKELAELLELVRNARPIRPDEL